MNRWIVPAGMWFVAVIIIASAAAGLTAGGDIKLQISGQKQLKKFSSYWELENFVRANTGYYNGYCYDDSLFPAPSVPMAPSGKVLGWVESRSYNCDYGRDYVKYIINGGVDHSTTNIQIGGVDEADIVKSDGKYIYVVSGNKVFIIEAYPAESVRVLSEIEAGGQPTELFINGDKLVVLGWAFVKVYDVSDRENSLLTRDVSFDGRYFNSRMIGDYVYVIINSPTIYYWAEEIDLPDISSNGNTKTVSATEIYYFENIRDYSYEFTTIMAINTQNDDQEITSETFLIGATQNLFVSSNNIYITYVNGMYPRILGRNVGAVTEKVDAVMEKTIIHKISIADGEIEYKSPGEVPGRVLNQFSMDEHQGYFRIATTTGWVDQNNVYVLDGDLNIVGRLEGLAPGERIYSARFMGSRAYLVAFKKIDPLFVIDLEDPKNPRALGELEIPGYSDYLHPYDETHLIGVGKDTVDMGSFAWYQGVKIALFDVSDPENPREISKYVIGDRGTDSYALSDHRAFLFSRSKNLLVIPILLAEIDEERYPGRVPPSAYGETVWQGAYVFNISVEDGLALKGRITHLENTWLDPPYYVKRTLYIEDVLYTVAEKTIKMNDLESLNEIGKVTLSPPYEVEMTGWQGDQDFQRMGTELESMAGLFATFIVAGGLLRCMC